MRKLLQLIDARDVHFYAGVGLTAAGLYHIYRPAALIVPGLILIYVAVRRV